MRLRRRAHDTRLPSGLAEVELFTFWEDDLAGEMPAERPAVPPQRPREPMTSSAPVWFAALIAVLVVTLALTL